MWGYDKEGNQKVRPECPYCGGLSSTYKLHESFSKRKEMICWACKQYENKHGFLVPPEERGGHRGTRQWGPQEAWRKEVKFRELGYRRHDYSNRTRTLVCVVAGECGVSGLSDNGKLQVTKLVNEWNRPIDLLAVSPEKHVFETAFILEMKEVRGHVLDLLREFRSPHPHLSKSELYRMASVELTEFEFPAKKLGVTINAANGDLLEVSPNSHAGQNGVTNSWSIEKIGDRNWDKVSLLESVKSDLPFKITFRKSLKDYGWDFDQIEEDVKMNSSEVEESLEELDYRILLFKKWLEKRPERHIVVVGHPYFLSRMMYGAEFSLEPCRCYEWRF